MFKYLFTLLLSFPFVKSNFCNYNGTIHEIRTQNDLNNLQDCTTFDGSLFINGEYNLENLDQLSNLKNISGYLLIWNSHNITDLTGLRNLEHIHGNQLYLDNYFVYIVDNHNLCFVNTLNWTKYNNQSFYRTALNRIGCPSCNQLCNGCWNNELCQSCKYFKSGNTCVEQCPIGTDIEESTCIEFIPFPPEDLEYHNLNFTIKNITWNPPSFPNGVILGYNFYLDENLIYTGMNTYYLLTDLSINTDYNIKVNVFNLEGESDNSTILLSIGNGLPEIPYNISNEIINQTIKIKWFSDGHQFHYQILNYTSNYTYEKELYLNDLNYYSNYSIKIKAFSHYGESNYSEWYDFISYESYPKIPDPAYLSLNNLSLNIKFNPNFPLNGKILKYNFRVFQNNNLFLNQSTIFDNINISTNYYKDYEINYNLTNSFGTSKNSDSSFISTPIGAPLIPSKPILNLSKYLTVVINEESDINGPIIKYEILMYYLNNYTTIYSDVKPGNITLNTFNQEGVYEFQSKVYTSDTLYAVSEKIGYSPSLSQDNGEMSWWIILLIVIGCLLLIGFIFIFVSYNHNKHLNKVCDSVVLNEDKRNNSFERINPAYQGANLPPVRHTNPLYHRSNSESHTYSEIERNAISNATYESLHTPSNPPNIYLPKNMLRD